MGAEAPDAGLAIAREHRNRDQKLDDSDHSLQCLVPDGAAGRHHPGELQCGSWQAQHTKEESNQNQPESPSAATEDRDDKESNERRKRNQKRCLDREAVTADRA
jgi:hypothetical protein